ncbi:MAG: hypothetical protein KF852_11755 [Saprospiraceae bacterium]|nr:hypothetical protein [Saprospiraceae bacterium]
MVMAYSCTKDSGQLPDGDLPAIVTQELEYRNAEETCRCFMSILRTSNIASSFSWALIDATEPHSGPTFEIEGVGNLWGYTTQTIFHHLPTPFIELKVPSDGEHMFYLVGYAANASFVPNDFRIDTEVRCYLYFNNNENGTLQTTTSHSFEWSQGSVPINCDGVICYRSFFRNFTCHIGTIEEPIILLPD